jgi:hypothetical protein
MKFLEKTINLSSVFDLKKIGNKFQSISMSTFMNASDLKSSSNLIKQLEMTEYQSEMTLEGVYDNEDLDQDTRNEDEDQSLSCTFTSTQALKLWKTMLFSCPLEDCFCPPVMASSAQSILNHLETVHNLKIRIHKFKEVLPYFEEYLNARLDILNLEIIKRNSSRMKVVKEWGLEGDQQDRNLRNRLQNLALVSNLSSQRYLESNLILRWTIEKCTRDFGARPKGAVY